MDKKQFDEWCAKGGAAEEGESTRDKALRLLKQIEASRAKQNNYLCQTLRLLDTQLGMVKSKNDLAHVRRNFGKLIEALEQDNGDRSATK